MNHPVQKYMLRTPRWKFVYTQPGGIEELYDSEREEYELHNLATSPEHTEILTDLRQRLTIPGFIEGHGHFVGLGDSKMMLDLRLAKTWKDVTDQVARVARSAPAGQWIIGRGWHQCGGTAERYHHLD